MGTEVDQADGLADWIALDHPGVPLSFRVFQKFSPMMDKATHVENLKLSGQATWMV
jgi:hypothetical protein